MALAVSARKKGTRLALLARQAKQGSGTRLHIQQGVKRLQRQQR
jgi:hypothetical protein